MNHAKQKQDCFTDTLTLADHPLMPAPCPAPSCPAQIYNGDKITLRSQRENKLCGVRSVALPAAGGAEAEAERHHVVLCGEFMSSKATSFIVGTR